MDLSKLPPFVAMSLGLLGCVAEPCLSFVPETESATTGTGTGSGTDTETTDIGPCLDPQIETTSTGPCLGAPMDSTGTDTGTGSDSGSGTGFESGSGSDSGSGSGSDSGTSGGMAVEPRPTTRAAVVERVLARGRLPVDVLERLRALATGAKG